MKTNRRNFFQTMGAGAAGLGLASAFPLTACAAQNRIILKMKMTSKFFLLAMILPLPILFMESSGIYSYAEFTSFAEFLMERIQAAKTVLCHHKNQNHGMIFFLQSGGEIQLLKSWITNTQMHRHHLPITGIMMM